MTFKKLINYFFYHIKEKWKFIYFEVEISNFELRFPFDDKLKIIDAKKKDIEKIEKDLFPFFTYKQEYDLKFIQKIEEDGIKCFVAEKEGKFVHYFMVFTNALESPLTKTPFNKNKIMQDDIYLGSAFTVPHERGSLILPSVLKEIFKFFKKNLKSKKRALLLVHEDTLGAEKFFSILGFKKL